MLQNSETEKLGFVQVSIVKGSWGNLLRTTVSSAYGYSIEVFRDRYYIGSTTVMGTSGTDHIRQQLKSMKVQNGDTLIWVSLTPRQVEMNVPLTTINGNYPVGKLTIMLKVDASRASDFANLFNQNNDPIEMVKPPIINTLQRYVRQRSYDELDDDEMRQRVVQSLYGENKQYGLIVESVPHISVPPDEHITQRIQITQEADTKALQDKVDQERTTHTNHFNHESSLQQSAYQRRQQELDNAHQRRQELQDSIHQPIKEDLTNQVRRNLNAGKSFYHIMDENPDIADIYALSPDNQPVGELPWQERARLASGNPDNMRMLEGKTTDSNQVEGDNAHQRTEQERNDTHQPGQDLQISHTEIGPAEMGVSGSNANLISNKVSHQDFIEIYEQALKQGYDKVKDETIGNWEESQGDSDDEQTKTEQAKLPIFAEEQETVSLSAIARAVLEEDDRAFVGKTYTVQAGISRSIPQRFQGATFDLPINNRTDSIEFDILLHASENVEFIGEWRKHLVYVLHHTEPQTVEFTFQLTAPGSSFLIVDFYREFCWVKTVRLQFDAIEKALQTKGSFEV